jgi:hypothetical protein
MYFDDGVVLNRFSAGSLNFHNRSPPEYQGSKSLAVGFLFSWSQLHGLAHEMKIG